MKPSPSTPLRCVTLVLIELPLVLFLILCDALAAAWDELFDDWRSFKHWITESWGGVQAGQWDVPAASQEAHAAGLAQSAPPTSNRTP